jgi:hypothetical protein
MNGRVILARFGFARGFFAAWPASVFIILPSAASSHHGVITDREYSFRLKLA